VGPTGNQYGTEETYKDIKVYLSMVDTTAAHAAQDILDKVWKIFDEFERNDDGDTDTYEALGRDLDPLCSDYYDISTQVINDVDDWMEKIFK